MPKNNRSVTIGLNKVHEKSCTRVSEFFSPASLMIADMKSKIILSHWYFFADMIFSATSKVQNYQYKTREKYQYPSQHMFTT